MSNGTPPGGYRSVTDDWALSDSMVWHACEIGSTSLTLNLVKKGASCLCGRAIPLEVVRLAEAREVARDAEDADADLEVGPR